MINVTQGSVEDGAGSDTESQFSFVLKFFSYSSDVGAKYRLRNFGIGNFVRVPLAQALLRFDEDECNCNARFFYVSRNFGNNSVESRIETNRSNRSFRRIVDRYKCKTHV